MRTWNLIMLDLLNATDNPLYTDTWHNDKMRYNDNLTVTS